MSKTPWQFWYHWRHVKGDHGKTTYDTPVPLSRIEMLKLVNRWNRLSAEHSGDWLYWIDEGQ